MRLPISLTQTGDGIILLGKEKKEDKGEIPFFYSTTL